MPGFLFALDTVMQCTHMAKATIAPSQTGVLLGPALQPAATMTSVISVAGCPFQVPVGPGTKPQPCVLVKWAMPSARVFAKGQPLALATGPGPGPAVCQSIEQIPAGPPVLSAVQIRVIGG